MVLVSCQTALPIFERLNGAMARPQSVRPPGIFDLRESENMVSISRIKTWSGTGLNGTSLLFDPINREGKERIVCGVASGDQGEVLLFTAAGLFSG